MGTSFFVLLFLSASYLHIEFQENLQVHTDHEKVDKLVGNFNGSCVRVCVFFLYSLGNILSTGQTSWWKKNIIVYRFGRFKVA